jgi:outer membrane protein TolC
MNTSHRARWWRIGLCLVWLCGLAAIVPVSAQTPDVPGAQPGAKKEEQLPEPRRATDKKTEKEREEEAAIEASLPQPPPSILPDASAVNSVDLSCVLRLAGVDNPDILIARQRIAEAVAQRLFAYAQALPNLNAGTNYDDHNGPLQQSDGNIIKVNRQALYVGSGAGAIAAGTVNIPGVLLAGNPGMGLFEMLAMRQLVRVRQFESLAVRNQIFLQVANGYLELLRAEAHRAIALRNREDAHEMARLMAVSAKFGRELEADANRANSELARRINEVIDAERQMLVASAQLARLLNLPPSIQLHAIDGYVVPTEVVPQKAPLSYLLGVAMNQRPELAARRAAIAMAIRRLRAAQVSPLTPTLWAGFSAGTFGGGSNLVAQGFGGFQQPYFGNFAPRDDVDVIAYWTAQNLGVGNWAQIRIRQSERQIANLELVRDLNMVRNDVARAFAGIHARWAQIDIARIGVLTAQRGYNEDYTRTLQARIRVLPIELLNNYRLLADARYNYLDSVVDYDQAQFALYVALGQPPPAVLAKAIPGDMPENKRGERLVPPPAPAPPLPACAPANGSAAPCNACPKKP